MRRLSLRAPVRGGVGQAAPFKGHPGPGPSGGCALCASFVSASVPEFEGAKCRHAQRQWNARVWSPQGAIVQCKESAALCSTAAGRPGAKGRVSVQDRHTTFVPVPPRYGFAVVQPGRYSSRPLPGRIPPEAFRAPRKQPYRLLAQRMPVIVRRMRQSRLLALPARIPRCPSSTAPEAPHQRCCRCVSIRRSVPVREDRCTPHQRHHALTPLSRPGPGAGGRLPSAQAAGLCRRLGA